MANYNIKILAKNYPILEILLKILLLYFNLV